MVLAHSNPIEPRAGEQRAAERLRCLQALTAALAQAHGHDDVADVTGSLSWLYIRSNPVLPTCSTAALAARVPEPYYATISGNDDTATCP